MPPLKIIRKRIGSIRSTQKITRAMKMVAAAKLRRAQNRLLKARPYATKMEELLGGIASLAPEHPLLKKREEVSKAEFLILTSDRGLCGGFNGNLLRKIEEFLRGGEGSLYKEVSLHMIGRKGRDFFRARNRELASIQVGIYDDFRFEQALSLANDFLDRYQKEGFDHLYLVYNRFKSAVTQEIQIAKILPIEPRPMEGYVPEYLYEPSRDEILDRLVPRGMATVIYRAFLESMTGEFGARMAAMENATNNCSDLIHRLTLDLNRARQAAITLELLDVVNGAEALK